MKHLEHGMSINHVLPSGIWTMKKSKNHGYFFVVHIVYGSFVFKKHNPFRVGQIYAYLSVALPPINFVKLY